ncbi:hypothetical protein [Solicola sp. PLA-1-18]|uniref:hypothetical protein n=1 Tax=Solicola sp. PLA-1-18 TaxID=3380532 RepID=UPI003B81A0D1
MTQTLSKTMSAATAAYAAFALAKPRHLGAAITDDARGQERYDLVATTFGFRDLAVSIAALRGTPSVTQAAMLVRIGLDLSDGAMLAASAPTSKARQKILAVTGTWAALNTAALLVDRRRAGRR